MGFMTIKIDLEKAYDCLSWRFIHDTLKRWDSLLIGLIILCIVLKPLKSRFLGMAQCWSGLNLRGVFIKDMLFPLIFLCFVLSDWIILFMLSLTQEDGSLFNYLVMVLFYLIYSLQMT